MNYSYGLIRTITLEFNPEAGREQWRASHECLYFWEYLLQYWGGRPSLRYQTGSLKYFQSDCAAVGQDLAAKNRRSYSQRLDKALDEIVHKSFSAVGFHVSGVALS